MSSSIELDDVDHLTTGTVGPPGRRVFYLQVRKAELIVSLRLEKSQVDALTRYLAAMLADLPALGDLPTEMDLVEPVVPEWVVGPLAVSYDELADRVVIVAEELVENEGEGSRARITATREQVAALAFHGTSVVEAGRPPCQLCGQPFDPDHACARQNGHRGLTR